jgi:hypothetical protein
MAAAEGHPLERGGGVTAESSHADGGEAQFNNHARKTYVCKQIQRARRSAVMPRRDNRALLAKYELFLRLACELGLQSRREHSNAPGHQHD